MRLRDSLLLPRAALLVGVFLLIVAGSLGDYGSAERSPSLILPADYAFGIWGVIFIGTLVFAIYQALPSQAANPLLRPLRSPLSYAFASAGLWVHVLPLGIYPLSQAFLLSTMGASALAYARLEGTSLRSKSRERWMVQEPIGLFTGWITLATVAASTEALLLAGYDRVGLGPLLWALFWLVAITLLGAWVMFRVPASLGFPLALIWGLIAIAVQHYAQAPAVAWTAAGASIVLALVLAASGTRPKPS